IAPEQINLFEAYFNILIAWNQRFNLTRITNRDDVIEKHFLDSLSCFVVYPHLPKKIIDVGSGAGFPGIPLKIFQPDIELTLVETTKKKVDFLEYLVQTLALPNIKIIHGRAEDLGQTSSFREMHDLAVARAVAPLSVLTEYLLPFVKVNGTMLALKSKLANEEIDQAKAALELLGGQIEEKVALTLPFSKLERTLIVIRKVRSTPPRFPRKAGIPTKRPIT
ncbi:MAG: 16S rRNA (guanine(527)-N(7))-methyltransferase RsmG, partial [Chloroflexota bacterium]